MQLDGPPVDGSYERLFDEFRAHVDALNTTAPGELVCVGHLGTSSGRPTILEVSSSFSLAQIATRRSR